MLTRLVAYLRGFAGRRRVDDEADDELRFHIEREVDANIARGLSPAEARRLALRDLGGLTQTAEAVRHVRSIWLDAVWHDLAHAARSLCRAPGFTSAVVLTLALGSGANAAIFSVFNQAVLRRLPVPDPERLVNLISPGPRPGRTSTSGTFGNDATFSYPLFRDLERRQTAFTGLAAHRDFGANVAYRGQASSDAGLAVSGSYFPVLALKPALGRLLGPDDDRSRDAHHVVVLSHEYWRTRFNADTTVLNDTLIVNGQQMTIVGVAPRGFSGTTLEYSPQVFVPLTMAALMMPGSRNNDDTGPWDGFEDRRDHWLYLFARLQPGVRRDAAETTTNAVFTGILGSIEFPVLQSSMGGSTGDRFRTRHLGLEPGGYGQRPERGELRQILVFLFSVTGIVLLIASANVANLVLARTTSRSTELAIRLALGAGRLRLVGHLLMESVLLAGLGGACGLGVAAGTLHLVASMMPSSSGAFRFDLDFALLVFSAALSVAMVLLFGLYPALHGTRRDLASALKSGSTGSEPRAAARFRVTLATAQIALSMALLILGGLFGKSLLNMSRVDLGIDVEHVLTFRLSPGLNGYTLDRAAALFDRMREELRATPDVSGVTVSSVPLLAGVASGTNITVEGFDPPPNTNMGTLFSRIGADYFHTLGIPLVAGREFSMSDVLGSPKVAIINQAFLRRFSLGPDAVGKRLYRGAGRPPDTEIVGVVQDAKYSQLKEPAPAQFFVPYRQEEPPSTLNFYVHTRQPANRAVPMIPGIVARVDGTVPVEGLRTMSAQAQATVTLDRLVAALSAACAALATVLAAVGVFGVLSYAVTRRTREIGLRMALGASVWDVQRLVLSSVGWMTVVGGALGIGAALGLTPLAQSMLFGVEGADPVVTVSAAAGLAAIALGAGAIPARRAARVSPTTALKME